ncbi:hypothetical protein LOK49_LG04G01601 [Camellia lanceoleosa]|uniref:Uncharacterized protein n=1 Tax=Camellia lanceoleosa TaxID=1840588 RepID=A0ACC0I177_9ERIC|nr:hypothetical protein LOK49_LG04G01601 [Camellia lanceoleosa]
MLRSTSSTTHQIHNSERDKEMEDNGKGKIGEGSGAKKGPATVIPAPKMTVKEMMFKTAVSFIKNNNDKKKEKKISPVVDHAADSA